MKMNKPKLQPKTSVNPTNTILSNRARHKQIPPVGLHLFKVQKLDKTPSIRQARDPLGSGESVLTGREHRGVF